MKYEFTLCTDRAKCKVRVDANTFEEAVSQINSILSNNERLLIPAEQEEQRLPSE